MPKKKFSARTKRALSFKRPARHISEKIATRTAMEIEKTNLTKDAIAEASKQIGLTDSQANSLWLALQQIHASKPTSHFSSALLYVGATVAFLSMTWFYTSHLTSGYSLLISFVYALLFFGSGFYFWHVKKLRVPAGVLCSLGIVMVPLMTYSLQNVLHWWPLSPIDSYGGFYRWIHGSFVPMEICTLTVASLVLHFIRFPFITVLVYSTLWFMSMDTIHLFTSLESDSWSYYCIASIAMGTILNILSIALCKQNQKDFAFWGYLFGMFLCWLGLTSWDIQTEWGYFTYFLINVACILLSSFFHRKIFIFFGSLGTIYYIGYLAYIFSDSSMFSYILGAIGFSIIMLAIFFMSTRKKHQTT